ncbi:hypothetical protein DFH08DRAFT_945524 [Mycena albidolilacea]|uniref:Uncharacterized protein n=1 Tax=Mycena albidolilacea TaxID=1033008 RepID=A0AAD6Z0P4_9AGAR|nr:hypothetical protein DFH08DRAFT_945524 [Mycena albidolilacea]
MPRQSTLKGIRVTNILECLTPALALLKELNDTFEPQFIKSIANTIESLMSMAQNAKWNKNECTQLMENIHPVLYAIISLYLKSETVGSLAPAMLDNIGKFTETLHKIYAFLKAQQDGNKFKHLFRNSEMQNLLQGCYAGLAQAAEVFKIATAPAMISEIGVIKETTQRMHEDLLELIQALSDGSTTSGRSSIFHGRESEVENIMKMLTQESPRIAILGGGGMDNMPLAVDLMAHLSDYEGLSNLLAQWDTERTALLSVGYDRKSNLDTSIQLSLSSPRITSNSKELLSLLSILPNGLSDAELVQSELPIPNILSCKSVLLATSLAYQDSDQRLRSLMPVREHVRQFLSPSTALVQCLCKLFYVLLQLYNKYNGNQLGSVVNQITQNLANFQEVLQRGLYDNALDLKDTIYSISILSSFYRVTGRGGLTLMEHIQSIVSGLDDHHLKIQFMTQVLLSYDYYPTFDREKIITQGISILEHVNNPLLESKFCNALGLYFINSKSDRPQAMQFYQRGLKLAKMCPDSNQECEVLVNMAQIQWMTGEYFAAQIHASEAQRLSQCSANLYDEASALWIEAACLRCLGNFKQSADQLHRSRVMLGVCGLDDGLLDQEIAISQGEIHLQKSEYAEARNIYNQIVETSSPEQDPFPYGISIVNIAHIATMCGDTRELTEEKFEIAKVKFKESLTSLAGQDNETELFCLGRLADIRDWPASEYHPRWPVMYCGRAYKSKDKLELHKALLFLGDMFLATKDGETATNLYIVSLEGFTHMDVHCSRAQCMVKDVAQIDARLSTVDKAHQKSLLELTALSAPDQLLNRETSEIQEVETAMLFQMRNQCEVGEKKRNPLFFFRLKV